MFRIKRPTIEQIVILLFSILPIVDSINGILITKGLPSIGTVYKLLTLGVLFTFSLRKGCISRPVILSVILSAVYILFSVAANMMLFKGTLLSADYPIKLFFNILTLAMLFNCVYAGYIDGNSFYRILNINTWLMIFAILVPYALGLGSTIYSSGVGYKAFFYSNNELSASLLILFYFSLHRLSRKVGIVELGQFGAITICVLLLNTKSGIAACLVGGALFFAEYMLRKDTKYKAVILVGILLALFVAKDFIIEQVDGFMNRQDYLYRLYGGSMIDTLLSGRTLFLEEAWANLAQDKLFLFRFFFGNGFCGTQLVEMDFVDIFFYLGAFGVLTLTVFFVVLFAKSWKAFKNDRSLVRPCGYLMVIGFAFLAGHVFFMATAGCYFVLMCCFNFTYKVQDNHHKLKEN